MIKDWIERQIRAIVAVIETKVDSVTADVDELKIKDEGGVSAYEGEAEEDLAELTAVGATEIKTVTVGMDNITENGQSKLKINGHVIDSVSWTTGDADDIYYAMNHTVKDGDVLTVTWEAFAAETPAKDMPWWVSYVGEMTA